LKHILFNVDYLNVSLGEGTKLSNSNEVEHQIFSKK